MQSCPSLSDMTMRHHYGCAAGEVCCLATGGTCAKLKDQRARASTYSKLYYTISIAIQ